MDQAQSILLQVAHDVLRTLQVNWVYLLLSIVLASAVQVFVGTDRLAGWLRTRTPLAVTGAVGLGALTPFCSCGTTAIVLGALASRVPWAPVVAFMVSSPLTSPGEYVLSIGLFGAGFATIYFVAAAVIGLASGWVTHHLERAGVLKNQHRVTEPVSDCSATATVTQGSLPASERQAAVMIPGTPSPSAGCSTAVLDAESGGAGTETARRSGTAREFARALLVNTKRLGILFFGFTALGYLIIRLMPAEALTGLLGNDSPFAVPLAALLGIPLYVASDGSLPLVASLMHGGMGQGAAMAFLITGAGTSIGAVSGMLLIARWRVVALVVASLVVGAIVTGYLTPLLT